ncbi:CRISPR-associated helicase Cas3' [Collinsella sp. An2]|uniref:CRISPR-associated helicase Cas3' n=1 Tax=Collinsella sp. An2 TaxID=1965585 RepID=UPI0013024691|nr:CRISPR-associated helicase Cas3' [Collinsella sp. An2]
MRWYAHSPSEERPGYWQNLDSHLLNVAALAKGFSDKFGFSVWGDVLGRLHDIGKATAAFQERLAGSRQHVDHATPGALFAYASFQTPQDKIAAAILAYAIAGHHGGMPNGLAKGPFAQRVPLTNRFKAYDDSDLAWVNARLGELGIALPGVKDLEPLPFLCRMPQSAQDDKAFRDSAVFSLSLLCRMLYSCLVDADYLDTEAFMMPSRANVRASSRPLALRELSDRLDHYLDALTASASPSAVNDARASILGSCRVAADNKPGVFTLTVPTGGGKTLSSLSFALRHAIAHGMERVIYAIPYTSIVEQTAQVFRNVLGAENVLEHHSNYDFEEDAERGEISRLLTQNWNAPIVVTTNVQLFESLFSNRPGKCRKVHNIARSVVVLDEAQTLPDGLLKPTLAMIEDLCLDFGASVVLCTATQPALAGLWPFGTEAREIVTNRNGFDRAFGGRTQFVWETEIDEQDLASRLVDERAVLCIVGTKSKAKSIYENVKSLIGVAEDQAECNGCCDFGLFHLSANMTPLHRSRVLEKIRARLTAGERCIVVSTQLIEAGVDIDFPSVYRELAGIDSLFQAAGRCNREGTRAQGEVHVFELLSDREKPTPHTWLERMKSIARALIERNGGVIDDELVPAFFRQRYETDGDGLDGKGIFRELTDRGLIESELKTLQLESVANEYRIIEDDTTPVFVPWGEDGAKMLCDLQRRIEHGVEPAALVMRMQRSSVSVRGYLYEKLKEAGAIDDESYQPLAVLQPDVGGNRYYSDEVGLLLPGEEELNDLIV